MTAKLGRPPAPVLPRLLDRVTIGHESGCWVWTGSTTPKGYGLISVNGRYQLVHRVSYEMFRGPIPEGLGLDHDPCDNPPCFYPEHLKPKTQGDNLARSRHRTMAAHRAGTCVSGRHDMTDPANVYLKANGDRQCKPCQQEKYRGQTEK